MSSRRPRLGFIGIHAGAAQDRPFSQDETLADLFAAEGYEVRRASAVRWPPLRTLHQLWALLTWRRVDVVLVAVFSGPSFAIADLASALGGRLWRRKVVLVLHGGELPTYAPAHRERVARVLDRADLVVAPSGFLADAFRPWGYDVRVIPNVLPLEQHPFRARPEPRPALLWMRTFHELYDPLGAVEVFRRVAEARPDATLTMAGADRGLLADVRARVDQLGLGDRVTFPGYLDAGGKARAFADHDVFLHTNRVDNMPVSVLEAAASGLVPVAARVGGIPALLADDVDAVLIEPGDHDAMAEAVLALLDDPARHRRLALAARQRAERSGWAAVRVRWEAELGLLHVPGTAPRRTRADG